MSAGATYLLLAIHYFGNLMPLLSSGAGEKCLRWLTCGTFKLTSASQKDAQNADSRLSKEKASKPDSFRLHQRTMQVAPYTPREVLVAWDWDTEEERRKVNASTQRWIPGEQYDLLVKRVIASDMSKSFEPSQHKTPKLLLRDAFLQEENGENAEDAGEDESSDEEASLSCLSDDDHMCE